MNDQRRELSSIASFFAVANIAEYVMRFHRTEQRISTTLFTVLLCVSLLLLGSGCSNSSGTVPIQGKVTYRGEAISSGALTFFPQAGRPVSTTLDENGDYSVELPPGDYRATVSVGVVLPPGYKEGDPIPPQKVALPPRYTTHAQTPLQATVTEDHSEPINFDL